MATKIVVRSMETGEAVHTIDVSGKSEAHIERAMMGMLMQMDTDRFTVGEED